MSWKEWDPFMKLGLILMIIGLVITVVSVYAEFAGWANDAGMMGFSLGTLVLIASGPLTLFFGAGRRQLSRIGQAVLETNARMGSVDGKLDRLQTMDDKLGAMGGQLGRLETMDTKLDKLETMDTKLDKLETMDTKLDQLDLIQAELDEQTGAMRHQTEVLIQIRDALTGGS